MEDPAMQQTMNVEKMRPNGSSVVSALDVSAGVHLSDLGERKKL